MKVIEGSIKARQGKIGIVVSRFNDFITSNLLEGCIDELLRNGAKKSNIIVVWVPGAWEIPVAALKLAQRKNVQSVICLGAVIRGETPHFDFVAKGACEGIQRAALLTGKPVILGVLTTDTINQAYQRSKKKGVNKGREAALAALEMINVLVKIKK